MNVPTSARVAVAVLAISGLVLAGCGDDGAPPEAEATTTSVPADVQPSTTLSSTSDAPPSTPPPSPVDEADEPPEGTAACGPTARPGGAPHVVANIPVGDPDGDLVARQLPGAGSPAIDVLTEGTVVDTYPVAASCAVLSDGTVWWEIGTPQLATGGWVNAAFLTPLGSPGSPPPPPGEDDFDVPSAQVACVYEGDLGACDLLELSGYSPDTNFGLGNSYSQAPDDILAADCDAGDLVACAEEASRGGE